MKQQRITFENGMLAVYADNVNILNEQDITSLEGEFVVDAKDVVNLVVALKNDMCAKVIKAVRCDYYTDYYPKLYTKDAAVQELSERSEYWAERCKEIERVLGKANRRNDNLIDKIRAFNALPWYKRIFKKITASKGE